MEKFHYLSDMLLYSLLLLLDVLSFMSRTSIKILSKAFIHFYHSVWENLNLHAKIISFFFIKVADNSMFLNTACTVLKEHVDIRDASLKKFESRRSSMKCEGTSFQCLKMADQKRALDSI